MLFNKVSGGGQKVTINGKPSTEKINLKEELLLRNLPRIKINYTSREVLNDGIFFKKINKYVFTDTEGYGYVLENAKPNYNEGYNNYRTIRSLSQGKLFLKNDEILSPFSGYSIIKINDDLSDRTVITSTPEWIADCFFVKEKNVLYGFSRTNIYIYSFESKEWTSIPINIKDDFVQNPRTEKNGNLYFLGTGADRKGIIQFDGKDFTEIQSALPTKVGGATRVFVLNGKIHIIGDVIDMLGEIHLSEGDSITNWIKESDLPFPLEKGCVAIGDGKFAIFGGKIDRDECVEMISSYIKE